MKKNKITLILGSLLAASLLIGCSKAGENAGAATSKVTKVESEKLALSENSGEEKKDYNGLVVHVGDQNSFFLIKIADKLGYFEEEFGKDGIKVEVSEFNGGPALNESFAAGEVDLGIAGTQPIIQSNINGVGIKAISSANYTAKGFGLLAGENSGIEKLEDLKGKKVAVGVGTNSHEVILTLLDSVGLTEDDIEIANLQTAESLNALETGDVDAGIFAEPQLTNAQENGAKLISTFEGYGYIICSFVGRTEFLEEYPEIASRYLEVLDRADKYYKEHPEETIQLVADYMDYSYEDVELKYYSRERGVSIDPTYLRDPISRTLDFVNSLELLDASGYTADDFIDTSYYENSKLAK